MSQKKFTTELLRDSGIEVNKRVVTPLPVHLKLHQSDSPLLSDPTLCRSLVGKLNFLTHTRAPWFTLPCPNTKQIHAEAHWSSFPDSPSYPQLCGQYCSQGILLNGSDQLHLQAFSDSDWAACLDTRISVTSYILRLGNSPISWKSKKQSIVSKSSVWGRISCPLFSSIWDHLDYPSSWGHQCYQPQTCHPFLWQSIFYSPCPQSHQPWTH